MARQEHPVHSMVILKSNNEELCRFFPLLASTQSQPISFEANETTSKISPIQHVEPCIIYTSVVNHGLFEEDKLYRFYVDTR